MTDELLHLINEIKHDKIRSILLSGDQSPLHKTFIEPALETLARCVIELESKIKEVGYDNTGINNN